MTTAKIVKTIQFLADYYYKNPIWNVLLFYYCDKCYVNSEFFITILLLLD